MELERAILDGMYLLYCIAFKLDIISDSKVHPHHNFKSICRKKGSKDREILVNGPFDFRITEGPWPDAKERYLTPQWIKYIDTVCENMYSSNSNRSSSDKCCIM